jgi:hypothetical protein
VALGALLGKPEKRQLFSSYPAFRKDHHASDVVCGTMRTL